MTDELRIPSDVQFRMLTIHQQHLTTEYDYLRFMVKEHEKELAIVSLLLVLNGILVYYCVARIRRLENSNDE